MKRGHGSRSLTDPSDLSRDILKVRRVMQWYLSNQTMPCETCLIRPLTCETCLIRLLTCETCLVRPLTCETCLIRPLTCETCLVRPRTCDTCLTRPLTCETCLSRPLTCSEGGVIALHNAYLIVQFLKIINAY